MQAQDLAYECIMRAKADVGPGSPRTSRMHREAGTMVITQTYLGNRAISAADYHRFDIGLKFLCELSMKGAVDQKDETACDDG